jgi:hypothetical protein
VLRNGQAKEYLENVFAKAGNENNTISSDKITEIENGFLFKFSHLSYRIIGNFSEYTMNMKANIKVFTDK